MRIRRQSAVGNVGPEVTILRPAAGATPAGGISAALPADLLGQARKRVRLLAGFFVVAFGFDLLIYAGTMIHAATTHQPPPDQFGQAASMQGVNLGAVLAASGLWWAAGNRRVGDARLHSLGLAFEIATCFVSAMLTNAQYYHDTGLIPHLTWVPAIIIMFPLILPGPPRRMLAAAIASAATSPLAIFLLDATGRIDAGDGSAYVPPTVGSVFAVVFAYHGARVVYGLGREVARARALGSYQLEERLGGGGMGEVWRARHRFLARPAAIKLIRPDLDDGGDAARSRAARERFEREAQAIAGLRSPHTVELFDFGVADDGSFYYAMELLEGLDADAMVRRCGPLPAERVVHVLRQVCHSLSEAESCGLVHRDIKPANIFLCRYGEDADFVKVLDFGIVTSRRGPQDDATALTGDQVVHGTPAFMAPEQALSHPVIDGRADIYAVGCVAYWLLTGKLVFTAATPTALLVEHVRTAPSAPSAVTELPIPAPLDDIVLACLAKDPAQRPASARELSRRLAEVEVASAWTQQRARQWWDMHQPRA